MDDGEQRLMMTSDFSLMFSSIDIYHGCLEESKTPQSTVRNFSSPFSKVTKQQVCSLLALYQHHLLFEHFSTTVHGHKEFFFLKKKKYYFVE